MKHLRMTAILLGLTLCFLQAPSALGSPLDDDEVPSELQDLITRYREDRGSLSRFYPLRMSEVDQHRNQEFTKRTLERLKEIEFDGLSLDGQIDYLLLRNHLQYALREFDTEQQRDQEIQTLVPFAEPINALEDARRRIEPVDSQGAAAALSKLTEQIDDLRAKVRDGAFEENQDSEPLKPSIALRASNRVRQLRETLRSWFRFYDGYDPIFSWWVKEPYGQADEALQRYANVLRERLAGVRDDDAIVGDPIGREALLSDLESEMIPYSPEELIAIAEREFAWCEAEMLRASNELGFADDWKAALEHVKTLYVEPGKQPELIHDLAVEAVEFLDERELVTIPELCRETWRMNMMSPQRQRVTPFFTGGEVISVSYPTDEMTHEEKLMSMRGNNRHFSRATVHHELIPGHHLQQFMQRRHRPYRQLFRTPFWVEGWALYWEMLLWDLDFPQSAEDRVGMLFWRMHRCARIIFSLNFHLEEMTPDEAIDFLVDRVGHERSNATGEVRRSFAGTYSPLYQCAYMLGGLQIRSLHEELVQSGRMTNREFHDAILKQNAIPIELIRARLTEQELERDFTSSWKFAGDDPLAEE